MDTQEAVEAIRSLLQELDRMKERGEQSKKMLKAFLKLSKKPEEKRIQKFFGLLRIRAWRNLVFETAQGKGAYIFLDIVNEFTEGENWEVECWKHLDLWEAYVESTRWDTIIEETNEPVQQASDEDPENGMGPQKKDPVPD